MKDDLPGAREDANETSLIGMSRRDFLELAGTGIFLFFTVGELPVFAQEGARRPIISMPRDFNAFLRISADGRVACYTGKIEMGQGVITSLRCVPTSSMFRFLPSTWPGETRTSVPGTWGPLDRCPRAFSALRSGLPEPRHAWF